ncbi:hypothetical protein [Couchioplanes caeruleus]|uniref:Uncharacterized protein n=2 Tax=Couchioplanes caeruleus TaxID=56438 RepID=A0A1K0FJH5_9ACTN|nr:hypothetical protein [Couchioplanes caeruleus]OJF12997.1 hypothetical protein BG844_17650 [Couchioplanes caeruleus subsp. caeruleus]ROP33615.1 hypothetical protein EDD30_6631 [Couchioplanes caeruleus]
MNTRRHAIDRATAEHLLSGGPARRDTVTEPLARLLDAATAPARAAELAGEDTAVAAFRRVHREPVPPPWRPDMIKTALVKLATAKLLAATAGAASIGGIALAAGTGSLPDAAQDVAHSAFDAPAPHAGASAHPDASAGPAPHAAASARPDASATAGRGEGSPSPSLTGLCQAYTARPAGERGKALDSPAFTVLVTTAGGRDKVDTYCAALSSAHPDASSRPSGGPDGNASHPTGAPAGHGRPTQGSAASHGPTGGPTSPGRPSTTPSHR